MDDAGPRARLSLRARMGTVRVRTTAISVLVVGMVLLIAGTAMVFLLRRMLTDEVQTSAFIRAQSIAARFSAGARSDPISVGDDEEEFVQVFDSAGRIVASSANVTGAKAVARLKPGETRRVDTVCFEDEAFVLTGASAAGAHGTFSATVGKSLDTVAESIRAVTRLLVAGLPLLLLIVGLTTWRLVGRALAPVEAMRAGADAISTSELHRRLPDVPGDDEIARLAQTMNRMLARLETGQARQRRFVSDASHELRSPVASIRQHAEVAMAHPDLTSVQELAEIVAEEDARLERVVDDLLLLTKIDEGTVALHYEEVDIDDLLFEEAARLRAATDLRIDTTGVTAARVSGDATRLRKLIRNLTDNAARHARGVISLGLSVNGTETVLTVDDDGHGVTPVDRARIFERFVRLDAARDRDSGGSGLGLAIVEEIAGAHRARVAVLDGPLGGARFEVRFGG